MPNTMITLVHAPACHFCADAQEALAELGRQFPITVELVEAESPDGAALVEEHRPAMFPLVLVDGEFFSTGRLPRRKLQAVLTKHAVGSST
jgi:glutaredoxin